MKTKYWLFVGLCIAISAWQPCRAEKIDFDVLQRITPDARPLDVVVSDDGRWMYVLTDAARLLIYSYEGELKGSVTVPEGTRRIAGRPGEDLLMLVAPEKGTIETVRINLVHNFSTEGSPTLGPAGAPVTLTLFTDFECSYCARLAPVLEAVHRRYPEKVRIVFKNYPLRMHDFAVEAALAALAAHDQGQFWPFHDRLFENYNQLDPQVIETIRKELELDAERFQNRMNDPALKELLRRDVEEGNAAGVSGTPTVFVNGKKYHGRMTVEGFQEAVEAVLAERP